MYLRANGVSLYFPAHGIAASAQRGPAGTRVGGSLVSYRGKPHIRALDDVNLSLEQGARLGIVGHNGSGKSTLLRTLAGLYTPQRGSIEAGGPVSGIFNMSIGFRQEASGYRNIVLKGLMAGRSRREIDAALPAIAEFTELGPYLDMPLHTYSAGMALRLAFAITTTFSHEILVMDEWIGAGDAQFQEKVIARMNSFVESAHICVLASHNNTLLRRVTDQCLWLEDGRIRNYGPSAEILEAYGEEARAMRAAALAEEGLSRLPIPEGHPVIQVHVPKRPGSRAVELSWDLEDFRVGRVKLSVYESSTGEERLVATAPALCSRRTGEWVREGMEFRLRDGLDDVLLGSVVIERGHFS